MKLVKLKLVKLVCEGCNKEMLRHSLAKYCHDCAKQRIKNNYNKQVSLRQQIIVLLQNDDCAEHKCGLKWSLMRLLHFDEEDVRNHDKTD